MSAVTHAVLAKQDAAGEDRTPDLRIMRPTRCQLRYCRSGGPVDVVDCVAAQWQMHLEREVQSVSKSVGRGQAIRHRNCEGREIRTPNLLIWSQTRCRCAIPPLTDHRVQICARAAKTCVQTNLLLIPQPARPRLRETRACQAAYGRRAAEHARAKRTQPQPSPPHRRVVSARLTATVS